MNKLFARIASITAGLALVVGAGVALASHAEAKGVKAADGDIEITFPGSPSQKTSAYTKTFTMTVSDVVFTFANWNNGSSSDSWDAIRGGQKSSAWTGTITSGAIANTVEKVVVNITSVSNSTGSKLEVASDSSFSSNLQTVDKGAITSTGNIEFVVPTQVENSYYRLTFTQSAKANGSIRVGGITYVAGADISGDTFGITYNGNASGARAVENMPNNVSGLEDGETYTLTGSPTRWGYTFLGWGASADATATISTVTIDGANETVYALWQEDHTVAGAWSDSPYTVAQAKAAIDSNSHLTEVYVAGTISQIDSYNSTYHSIQYWISDDGTTTNQFEVYSGKGINGADFSATTDIELGASVVVKGNIKKYNSTYEFDYNNYQVSYTAPAHEDPTVKLSSYHAHLISGGDSVAVTADYESFSGTPALSVSGNSHVGVSISGSTVTISPTSVGTDELTVTATYNTESASKTFKVIVTAHAGTEADPLTVSEAIAVIDVVETEVSYVSGIVSQVDSISSGAITYWISADGTTTTQLQCYKGKGISGASFSALTDVEVGASVVVTGTLKKYNTTYEFDQYNTQVSYSTGEKVLDSITLDTTNVKLSFEVNEEFSFDGLVVTAHYEGGSSKEVIPTLIPDPDMTSVGEKTVTVSYTEGEVTKTAEYQIQVTAPQAKHTITFLPGEGGTGEMAPVEVNENEDYTLPACTFTAPSGKVFDYWEVNGEPTTVIQVDDDYEATAIWKDAPSETTTTYDFSSAVDEAWVASMDKTTTDTSLGRGVGWGAAKGEITLTLSNSSKVNSVVITASTNNTGNTLSVSVGGTAYGEAQEIASGTGNKNKEYTFSGSSTGDVVITINDAAKTVYVLAIAVTVEGSAPTPVEKELVSIALSGEYKTSFNVGETFSFGGVVTATYDDDSEKNVTASAVFSGFDSSAVAESQTITVSYTEGGVTKDTSYVISVNEVVVATYKKVETDLADFSGSYLIVYESSESAGYAFNGSLSTFDATSNGVAVNISNGTIQLSEQYEFTIAKKENGYSLKSKSGYYLGKTAYANAIDQDETDKFTNQIKYSEGVMAVHGEGNKDDDYVVLRYNATSGQDRFRFMKNNGVNPISLYQKVDEAEALALDILNLTEATCSAQGEKLAYETAWTTLATKYEAVTDKSKLVETVADANGVMLKEALARYDYLVARFGLDPFIDGRVISARYIPAMETTVDSNVAIMVVTIVAITSISAIGVILVIKRRKAIR